MERNGATKGATKRPRDEAEESTKPALALTQDDGIDQQQSALRNTTDETNADTSSDDEMGPALPSATAAPPKKKRRTLPHQSLYLAALPRSTRYSKSLMHKAVLSFVTVTPYTDFLITASVDGQVSFWKKAGAGAGGVEFVKEFKAHEGEIVGVSVSWDGRNYASAGKDGTIKIWDVETFDLISVLNLEKTPNSVCWVHGPARGGVPLLAVGNEMDGEIAIFDGRGERETPNHVVKGVHRKPVVAMALNGHFDCVVSADSSGMLEYWRPSGTFEKPDNVFAMKSGTNLFDFKKAKSVPTSLTISPTGKQFATFSFPDRKVRVFDFTTGKLFRSYDESINTISEMQQAGTAVTLLEDVEFGRRLAVEREIETPAIRNHINVIFDETGYFILYGSLYGTKVINTLTNKVLKVYGRDEPFRSLNLTLYQGQPDKKGVVTVEMAASDNPLLQEAEARDAMLVSTGSGKVRFYMFTNEEEITKSTRDVQNEKPQHLSKSKKSTEKAAPTLPTSATLHTTYGDITLRLFPQAAPKAVENFAGLSRSNAYNNVLFHRVIRKFMIQTGDYEFGDGTGGKSIWGSDFENEISDTLKHDKPYTLSMANAGPGTNASQFFITTERCPWLDGKHTVFGRATGGLDVVHRIENVKVVKEKPLDEVRIVNIDVGE